jgi:hypothetical protein
MQPFDPDLELQAFLQSTQWKESLDPFNQGFSEYDSTMARVPSGREMIDLSGYEANPQTTTSILNSLGLNAEHTSRLMTSPFSHPAVLYLQSDSPLPLEHLVGSTSSQAFYGRSLEETAIINPQVSYMTADSESQKLESIFPFQSVPGDDFDDAITFARVTGTVDPSSLLDSEHALLKMAPTAPKPSMLFATDQLAAASDAYTGTVASGSNLKEKKTQKDPKKAVLREAQFLVQKLVLTVDPFPPSEMAQSMVERAAKNMNFRKFIVRHSGCHLF